MSFQEFATKGIFGPEGFVATFCNEQSSTSSSLCHVNLPLSNSQSQVKSGMSSQKTRIEPDCKKRVGVKRRSGKKSKNTENVTKLLGPISECGNINEAREISPEEQAFSIDLILKKILLYLKPQDLTAARSVSMRWNLLASTYIERNQTLRIFSVNKKENSKYKVRIKHRNQSVTERNLDDLTHIMKNIEKYGFQHKFPCSYFRFDGGTLNNPYLQTFLNIQGRYIKKLKLNLNLKVHGLKNISYIRKLLVDQAPNIEHLKLEDYQKQYTRSNLNEDDKLLFLEETEKLPNLKVLELNNNMPRIIFDEILAAAVNLQQVVMYPTYYHANFNYFIEANKLHLIKRLIFAPSTENVDSFDEISREDLKLKKLDLSLWGVISNWESREILPRIAEILSQILESSAGTLERIKWQPVRFLPGVQIPAVFPRVTKLCIEDTLTLHKDVHREIGIFPAGLSLSQTFPNLRSISIELPTSDEDLTQFLYFSQFEPVPSVREFYMKIPSRSSNQYAVECIERFSTMFPFVECAGFGGIKNFLKVSRGIWKFSRLKKLALSFDAVYEHDVPVMDAGFTGFDEDTCSRLLVDDMSGHETVRSRPSIMDLKDLRMLTIELYDEVDGERFDFYVPTISHLSGKYAFSMCPLLEVSIKVRAAAVQNISYLKEIALPLRPYVTSGPW